MSASPDVSSAAGGIATFVLPRAMVLAPPSVFGSDVSGITVGAVGGA